MCIKGQGPAGAAYTIYMQSLSRDDLKFLLSGALGALLVAVVAVAAYQGYQRAHRQAAPQKSPQELTTQEREQSIQEFKPSQAALGTEASLNEQTRQESIQNFTPSAGSGAATLTPEERQKSIDDFKPSL